MSSEWLSSSSSLSIVGYGVAAFLLVRAGIHLFGGGGGGSDIDKQKAKKMDDYETRLSDASDVEDDEQTGAEMDDSSITAENKLKHNIAKKGANSYYYAHAKKADAPTVRNEPPQLLNNAQGNLAKGLIRPFEKFAWADGTKSVTVYLTQPNADKIPDDKIVLVSEKKSFELKVEDENGVVFGMKVNKLNGEITGADLKKKADKIVVSLKKVEERTWYRLEE